MQSTLRLVAAALFSLAWQLSLPFGVQAQPLRKTVVVTFAVRGDPSALDVATSAEDLLSLRHIPLIPLHDARDRFGAVSRPPQEPTRSDLDSLAVEAHSAVEHVAFGRSAAAEQSVRQIVTLAERSLESLNRETRNARQLLDACLALVRSSLHDGKRDQAIEQAMGCRRLVPDLVPSQTAQPANVVGVLAEADDELRRMRIGSLKVTSAPQPSCSVYLNGRHLGMTPFALDRAAVGVYRVQVECDERVPGRVHVVHLGDDPVDLRVDSEFDGSVLIEPRLGLSYADTARLQGALPSHAFRLGLDVGAEDVIVIRHASAAIDLVRVNIKLRRVVAAVHTSAAAWRAAPGKSLADALDTLVQGRFVGVPANHYGPVDAPGLDLNVAHTAAARQRVPHPAPPPQRPLYKKWWLWTTVGVVVAGGVAAGLVLGLRRDHGGASDDPTISIPGR